MECKLSNAFVNTYLQCMEDTESPRLHHVWSLLTCISGALGRRNYFPFGITNIYPNMFVVLSGPPALKKSTSVDLAAAFLRDNTSVKFSPDDTAGRYQGLIAAMKDVSEEAGFKQELEREITWADIENLELNVSVDDKNYLFVHAPEWGGFVGQNNRDLLIFLLKMWNGDDFKYQLKKEMINLKDPLMSMLGGSTPTDIGTCIPPQAMGQGFMSRIVFVYWPKRYKKVSIPAPLPEDLVAEINNRFNYIYYNMSGPFNYTPDVLAMISDLYDKETNIEDHRFVYYSNRRQTHLLKVMMCLCAARGGKDINIYDVMDADVLLKETEKYMPDALGEYGMSPIAAATQKLVDLLKNTKSPLSTDVLWNMMSKEIPKKMDFMGVINDLTNSGKVLRVQLGANEYGYMSPVGDEERQIIQTLVKKST